MVKKILLVLIMAIHLDSIASVYFVSTHGNDNNPGTFSSPWLTWQKAFETPVAGDTVYIRGGIYYVSGFMKDGVCAGVNISDRSGTVARRIVIQNYHEEVPVLDGSKMTANAVRRGISIYNCSYFVLKGLTVRNVQEYGKYPGCPVATSILLINSQYIDFERCVVYGCGDGFSTSGFCDYIKFINCDSFRNADFTDNGGFSNGFTLTMYRARGIYAQSTHVSLTGCRSWGNSDDGFDTYGANGYFTFNDCWSWDNGWGGGGKGNGDGFKSQQYNDPEKGVQRTFIRCIAWNNRDQGFTSHVKGSDSTGIQIVYNCTAFKNGTNGFSFGLSDGVVPPCILRNNLSYMNGRAQYLGFQKYVQDHNTWNRGFKVSNEDFLTLDDSEADRPRKSDGSLPDTPFLKLRQGSQLIDAGVNVNMPYKGTAPDIGAFESQFNSTDNSSHDSRQSKHPGSFRKFHRK